MAIKVASFLLTILSHQYLKGVQHQKPTTGTDWLKSKYGPQIVVRPQWYKPVEAKYKQAQFYNPEFPVGGDFSLDHMISWSVILETVGRALESWDSGQSTESDLTDIISMIFKIDEEAYVNNNFCLGHPNLPQGCFGGTHTAILRKTQPDNKTLEWFNNAFAQFALEDVWEIEQKLLTSGIPVSDASNTELVRTMLYYLYHAPANLRYGDSKTNSSIAERMDPMGSPNGGLTWKEWEVYNWFSGICSLAGPWIQGNCVTPDKKTTWSVCLKSSTGLNRVVDNANPSKQFWSIVYVEMI